MSMHSVLVIAGTAAVLALCLLAPVAGNLLGIMPKRWRPWMLGLGRKSEPPKTNDIIL